MIWLSLGIFVLNFLCAYCAYRAGFYNALYHVMVAMRPLALDFDLRHSDDLNFQKVKVEFCCFMHICGEMKPPSVTQRMRNIFTSSE